MKTPYKPSKITVALISAVTRVIGWIPAGDKPETAVFWALRLWNVPLLNKLLADNHNKFTDDHKSEFLQFVGRLKTKLEENGALSSSDLPISLPLSDEQIADRVNGAFEALLAHNMIPTNIAEQVRMVHHLRTSKGGELTAATIAFTDHPLVAPAAKNRVVDRCLRSIFSSIGERYGTDKHNNEIDPGAALEYLGAHMEQIDWTACPPDRESPLWHKAVKILPVPLLLRLLDTSPSICKQYTFLMVLPQRESTPIEVFEKMEEHGVAVSALLGLDLKDTMMDAIKYGVGGSPVPGHIALPRFKKDRKDYLTHRASKIQQQTLLAAVNSVVNTNASLDVSVEAGEPDGNCTPSPSPSKRRKI